MDNEEEAEVETVDFTKPDFVFDPNRRHQWHQEGPYVICQGCELKHASYIGMERLMVGLEEDGTPILKDRSEV